MPYFRYSEFRGRHYLRSFSNFSMVFHCPWEEFEMSSLGLDAKPVLLPPDTCPFLHPLFTPLVPYYSSTLPRLSPLTRLALASGLKYFLPHPFHFLLFL